MLLASLQFSKKKIFKSPSNPCRLEADYRMACILEFFVHLDKPCFLVALVLKVKMAL
jgi:hypothetical protein